MTRPSKGRALQIWRMFKIGAMTIAPILLLILPGNYFDHSQTSFSVFEWLGVSGHYSQGLTRACMHLLHFDFEGATRFNKLSFVIVPLLVIIWVGALYREIRRYRGI